MNSRSQELEFQSARLRRGVEKSSWADAVDALQEVSVLVQEFQRVELSIQAQSLRRELEHRMLAPESPRGFSERYETLLEGLRHLAWSAQR